MIAEFGDKEPLGDLLGLDVLEPYTGLVDLLSGESVPTPFGRIYIDLAILGDHIALYPGPGNVCITGDVVF
jgi:hypothetical protein